MASAGQYIINKLKTVDNCQHKCDCCQSLQQQINQLKAEIKAIPRINEAQLIQKTEASLTPKLPNLITPFLNIQLNPIKNFQSKQLTDQKQLLTKILNNEKATKAAAEFAKRAEIKQLTKNREFLNKILKTESATRTAQRTANTGLKRSGSALAKIASITIQLAGFGVAVGTLKLVETRFDQQEKADQALSKDLSKALGLIGQNRALIKSNDVEIDKNKQRIGNVSDSAYSAQKQATKAREIGEKANSNSKQNLKLINNLIPKINKNEITANQAFLKANEANNKAQEALKEAIKARNKAASIPGSNNTTTTNNPKTSNGDKVTNGQLQQLLRQTQANGSKLQSNSNKLDRIIGLTTPIAPAIGKINSNVSKVDRKVTDMPKSKAFSNAVSNATCKTLNSDSCTSRLREDIKRHDTANGNILLKRLGGKLDRILNVGSAGANALQVSLLNTINKKMGAQLPGGLSGTFGRLWNLLQVDRALNILNFLTSLHNATMLSTNVIETLTSVIDAGADLVGFKIKNEKDEEINTSKFLSNIFNDALNKIFGAANVAEFKAKLAAANRIYQSTTNMFSEVRDMFDSGRQLTELVSNNTGKIGNALKKAGVIFENAFDWMSEDNRTGTPRQRKWERLRLGLDEIDDKLSDFNSIIGEVKSVQDNINNLKETTRQFEDSNKKDFSRVFDSAKENKLLSQLNVEVNDTDITRSE